MRLTTFFLILMLSASAHSLSLSDLDLSAEEFCVIGPKAQLRNELIYQPNQVDPYTGPTVCTYAINGQWALKGYLLEGMAHGEWQTWYLNGQRKSQTHYDSGRVTGTWKYWHQNGQLSEESIFDNNGKIVSEKTWNEDGTVYNSPPLNHAWVVQLASFKTESQAKNWLHKLLKDKHPAYIEQSNDNFRLFVGPVPSREKAEKVRAALKQQYKLTGFIVTYKGSK